MTQARSCRSNAGKRGLTSPSNACREAFGELYAGQAGQMAERMGRLRAKEVAKRDAFLKHVERYLPAPLLAGEDLPNKAAHFTIRCSVYRCLP